MRKWMICLLAGAAAFAGTACEKETQETVTPTIGSESSVTPGVQEDTPAPTQTPTEAVQIDWEERFASLTLTESLKKNNENNPIMTQRFGADPYVIEYNGRVYVYMTGDKMRFNTDGTLKQNDYSNINTLCVVSSADLVNWQDHGTIFAAGVNGQANWGKNSWAPAVCKKEIDGKMKFFIYFANGAGGIGVLTSDSPEGPFVDPLGKALINRNTPNCDTVKWLFDPAVLIDDDGSAYLYFGGGVPEGMEAHPMTGRVVKLGADMISLDGEPQTMDTPYLFEDSGINKIGDTYYYSYCTNWDVDKEGGALYNIGNANIAYMTSDNPMGPFTMQGAILKNPGSYFGCYGNNHHCIFTFKDQLYIAYHSQVVEKAMGYSGGYRSTHLDKVTVNEDGSIAKITGTRVGVEAVGELDPYQVVPAETMQNMAGINTRQYGETAEAYGSGNMVVTDISDGDWIHLANAAFGEKGAKSFTANLVLGKEASGCILIRTGDLNTGKNVGYVEISGEEGECSITAELTEEVTGTTDLNFIFCGEGYEWDSFSFTEK